MSEIQVRLLGHASVEITCGKTRIITDPWLKGTAFLGGWQRKYNPPDDWEKSLQRADMIYVSHGHSDHFSPETLRHTAAPIVVPDFPMRSAERAAKREDIRVTPVKMGQWNVLGDCRVKILPDTSPGHEDSGLIVEYKGKYLINTVDCCMPNGLDLPSENVEWLLAPFAGGSSPYPVSYIPMYTVEKAQGIMRKRNAALLKALYRLVEITKPEKLMPFAGFYKETSPYIRSLNLHNFIEDITVPCEIVKPTLKENEVDERIWFPDYVEPNLISYFTSYDFKKHGRELRITGLAELGFSVSMLGSGGDRWTQMHVRRRKVFAHAINNRIPIDELAIGYHLQLHRDPDVYEADFWEHINFKVGL